LRYLSIDYTNRGISWT